MQLSVYFNTLECCLLKIHNTYFLKLCGNHLPVYRIVLANTYVWQGQGHTGNHCYAYSMPIRCLQNAS